MGRTPGKVALGEVKGADFIGNGRFSGAAERTFVGKGLAQGGTEDAAVCGPACTGGNI